MATLGGLRARLIRDSLEELVRSGLTARGWFAAGRYHSPIQVVSEPNDWDEPITVNSIAISGGDLVDDDIELGSSACEDRWTYYVDFYGENESIGLDVATEIRDILRGKLPSIGRSAPVMSVLDFRQATPTALFSCDLENIFVDRGRGFSQPWLRYWFSVRVEIVDQHYGDN